MRRIALVISAVLAAFIVTAPTMAAAWEVNTATRMPKGEILKHPRLVNAWMGRFEMDSVYDVYFEPAGDDMWVTDNKADGHAGVMRWEFRKMAGRKVDRTVVRSGACVSTSGVHTTGRCSKDLPEFGYLKFWAGYRTGSTTTKTGLKLGDPVCVVLDGGDVVVDPDCKALRLYSVP